MTRNDDHLQDASLQKLEWVTPKIALMEAEDTKGKVFIIGAEITIAGNDAGPS